MLVQLLNQNIRAGLWACVVLAVPNTVGNGSSTQLVDATQQATTTHYFTLISASWFQLQLASPSDYETLSISK
jgi:hypothetical protein